MNTELINFLLIEDNLGDARLIHEMLIEAKFVAFNLEHCDYLDSGLARLSASGIDVILLDLSLPDSHGFETFKRVYQAVPEIPILVLTGLDDEEMAVKAVHAGAQDYLMKGELNSGILSRAIRYAIERKRTSLILQETMERYQELFENAPIAYFTITDDGLIERCNQVASELVCCQQKEGLVGRPLLDLFPDTIQGRSRAATIIKRVFREGKSINDEELLMQRLDGTRLWISLTANPIWQANGKVLESRMMALNITERVQHEHEMEAVAKVAAALRKAETRTEMIPIILNLTNDMAQSEGAIFNRYDQHTGEVYTELGIGTWSHMTGVNLARGEGLSADVIFKGEVYVNNQIANESRVAKPELLAGLTAAVGVPLIAQGQTIGVLWTGRRTAFNDGDVQMIVTIAEMAANAIYRASLYEQTQEQAQQVQAIMNNVPEGVILLDGNHHVIQANPIGQEYLSILTNIKVGEVITHLDDQPLATLLNNPNSWLELEIGNPPQLFEAAARPISTGPQAGGHVIVLRDVTEARQQTKVLQSQERLATMGQFAAGIAHDFNNIVSIITLYSELIQKNAKLLPTKDQERLETISQQAFRASNLIGQILDYSRQSVMARQALNILPLLKELTKLLNRIMPENINVHFDYDDMPAVVNADSTRLQQVVMNLAINARDAMPDGGTLSISLSRQTSTTIQLPPVSALAAGDWIKLSVSDTGSGVDEADLPHIFEPFFTTKAPGEGTGLGLAQVYGIVDQHDGYLDVSSSKGAGTTFTIYLPVVHLEKKLKGRVINPARNGSSSGETILVVEDNETARDALCATLKALNYDVLSAKNGEAALEMFSLNLEKISLVMSDVVMPGMGGSALFTRIKAIKPDVKLVFVTGYPLGDLEKQMLSEDVTSWIQKPLKINKIASVVQEIFAV